jgi:hypothetical protein
MYRILFAAIVSVACSAVVLADVRTDEKTQLKFEGMMGRMLNMFGGKTTREGSTSTVAVKGNRKATRTDSTGQIVDLDEEKIYDVDFKDKSYRVTTFAEIRRQMEEARKKAAEAAAKESGTPREERQEAEKPEEPQVEVDFSLKESGQKREINGFSAREVVMTIAVREKGKKLEESGGMVLTSNTWLAPRIPAMNEVAEFDLRYAQKLNASVMFDAQQTAALMAMYPMMSEAMKRFEAENVNMDGTAVLTVTTVQAVANPEQAKQQQQEQSSAQETPRSLGGLGGAIGGRLGRRILGGNKEEAAPSTPGRATIMTMTHELLKVSPAVADADVAIPAGFKQKS